MIWLKITMAAVMSGSLFAVLEAVLPPRAPQPFTVEISDWPGDQVFTLIAPLGMDHTFRVTPDVRRAAPDHDPLEAFRRGLTDAVLVGLDRLPELEDDDIRVIYAYDEVSSGLLMPAPGVAQAEDLRNRRIAVGFGLPGYGLAWALLARAGVDAGQVALMPVAPESAATTLAAGRAGAVVLLALPPVAAQDRPLDARPLMSVRNQPGIATHVLVVRRERLSDQRERFLAVIRALDGVARKCRAAPERCLELVAQESGRPASAWLDEYAALHLLDLAENHTLFTAGTPPPLVRRAATAFAEANGPHGRHGPTASGSPAWLDSSLIEEAQK